MKAIENFKKEIVPRAIQTLDTGEQMEEIPGQRSSLKRATFEYKGDTYDVVEQNKLKKSRFAVLANKGHEVFWIIRKSDGDWFLVIDGKWVNKKMVTEEGVPKEAIF
jgi:hypothetical protein